MIHFIKLLTGTILLRPYVFVFFAAYLFLAITHIGWKRTALFTALAYLVAFGCEWSSAVAATGFPFGLYYYIDTTSHMELWIAGVPFMDSLSFTFLSYVSWELATSLLSKVKASRRDAQAINSGEVRKSWAAALLASFLMMYLDVIIRLFVRSEKIIFGKSLKVATGVIDYRYKALGPVGLYFGVLGFNLFMTFWIGETTLGVVGVFIVLPLVVMIILSKGFR